MQFFYHIRLLASNIMLLAIVTALQTPIVLGSEDLVCGARCAKIVLDYKQISPAPSLMELARELHGSGLARQTDCAKLVQLLKTYGLNWDAFQVTTSELVHIPPFSIVHSHSKTSLNAGHFQLFLRAANDDVTLWDGLTGIIVVDKATFLSRFSGVVIADSDLAPKYSFTDTEQMLSVVLASTLGIFCLFGLHIRSKRGQVKPTEQLA